MFYAGRDKGNLSCEYLEHEHGGFMRYGNSKTR